MFPTALASLTASRRPSTVSVSALSAALTSAPDLPDERQVDRAEDRAPDQDDPVARAVVVEVGLREDARASRSRVAGHCPDCQGH